MYFFSFCIIFIQLLIQDRIIYKLYECVVLLFALVLKIKPNTFISSLAFLMCLKRRCSTLHLFVEDFIKTPIYQNHSMHALTCFETKPNVGYLSVEIKTLQRLSTKMLYLSKIKSE